MEPISIIVGALLTGAAAAANKTANQAVTDAYVGLKSLLKRLFESKGKSAESLDAPDQRQDELTAILEQTKASEVQEIMVGARKLISLAEKSGSTVYQVSADKIGIVGDQAHVESQNF